MVKLSRSLSYLLLYGVAALVEKSNSFSYQTSTLNAFTLSPPISQSKTRLHQTNVFDIIKEATVINPITGESCKALDGVTNLNKRNDPTTILKNILGGKNDDNEDTYTLVIVMPQLGDFDSAEYAEMLVAVEEDLTKAKISLRVIGIGDEGSAKKFAEFNGLRLDAIRMDKEGSLHKALELHAGPNWDVPTIIPTGVLQWFADYVGATAADGKDSDRDVKAIARAWLNYMAMCAGIAAPDTLPEILRGYIGDKDAPERIRSDEVVTVGGGKDEDPFIAITGVRNVKLGPFQYEQLWKDKSGYQRPVELATVRLRVMVEVLTNFAEYVPDQRFLDLRGATFLFGGENNDLLYKHIDTGVLSYSKTMRRPLSYLEPYIGQKALNPLGLGDPLIK